MVAVPGRGQVEMPSSTPIVKNAMGRPLRAAAARANIRIRIEMEAENAAVPTRKQPFRSAKLAALPRIAATARAEADSDS
jgi:hypothetical protein